MKKYLLIIFSILLLFSSEVNAQIARILDGSNKTWRKFQTLKLESKTEIYGLLYETTIDSKIKLGQGYRNGMDCQDPYHGKYEFEWNFRLPQDAYIKELLVWNKTSQSFVSATTLDLTTAENEYQPGMDDSTRAILRQYMRRDYNGSYDQQYNLKISPINWDEPVEFVIKYISPCTIYYNKRVVEDHSSQFYFPTYNSYCHESVPATFSVIDYNNPDTAPSYYSGFSGDWKKEGNFWVSNIGEDNYYDNFKLSFPAETESGKFLRTYQGTNNNFYQLTTKPFINDELRYPRKIVVAFDLKEEYISTYSRANFLNMIKNALMISTTEKDSLIFVTSDFNVHWLKNNFQPRTEDLITSGISTVNQIIPKLNTLPYMLKEIVQFLNEKETDAEVWLVSDDNQTGIRAETVMELLEQTYYSAKHKIIFNIADATQGYHSYYIQNKLYRGNGYLYKNLTRLSGGNFNSLYYKHYLTFIDEMLDCWAPKVTTVEIDPIPQTGITYSRIKMNNGINNFNISSRYGELGIYEGSIPFDVNYYGYYLGDRYFKNFSIDEDNSEISEEIIQNTGLYWYGNYIMKELFVQPQSFSTIKYIEDLSVENHLLTPYTGFIIPGPSGYKGFKRVYLDDQVLSVKHDDVEKENLPKELSLQAYPNPFNPTTTIVMELSSNSINTNKRLDIYNILGQKVKSFDLSEYDSTNKIKVVWNGLNDNGEAVSSGIYIAILKTDVQIKSLKLSLLR